MIAIAAAVIVVALVTAFVTYRAELWGGTSLPDAAQIAAETSEDGSDTATDEVTADQAAKALESRGLKSKRVYEFSARDKGIFLGYVDRDAGQRVADDSTVELRVSAGPGVPQGTVGSQVSDVVDSLESMGVPGQYCKATVTDSEDCITLETAQEPSYFSDAGNTAIRIAGHDDSMVLYNYNQNIELSMLVGGEAVESGSVDYDSLPMRNHLLLSGWGMFEVYAGQGVANCGTEQLDDWDSAYCVDGTYHTFDPSDGVPDDLSYTGITYDMQDFIVYFPVGSDIDALEASGYFDADALAEAVAQDDVDTSRPFILVRDPSLYDTTSVDVDDVDADPFVPGNQDGDNPLVAMKPAISNDTVYYLVENAEPDWDSLPDADVDTTNADAAQ